MITGMFNEKQFEAMLADCPNINEKYDFCTLVGKHNGGNYSRNEFLYWFHFLWKHIPRNFLYKTYKELLSMTECGAWYSDFFKPEILAEVTKHNKYDTVENPALISLLDNQGFLTVHHGHCKKTMRNSNSWTLKKETALWFGRRNAMLNNNPEYYCVTGRVNIKNVIAFIDERNEAEIVVLQKNVMNKIKEYFKYLKS